MPDVRQVTRETARDDEDCINPDVVAIAGIARREALGRNRDTSQAIFVQRPACCLLSRALLDLDKSQHSATPGHQIHLAARYPHAMREDAPAP